ncbi:MAG: nucleolar 14 family protein [Gammaproteobacteria bacterium]|nr:nucleolar 14 family protein [Gammaproteobacteria bacterium]
MNATTPHLRTFLAPLTVALALASFDAAAARFKCWTNDEGVRECGNVIPPQYSQKTHEVVNKQGVTVKRHDRAKTKEEIAAEEKVAAEKAAREKEEQRLAKIRAAKDRVLLDTFTTEDDLVLAHKGRLAALESRITHTRQILNGLNKELAALHKEAAGHERAGKALPKSLATRIARIESQIADNSGFITDRNDKKGELDTQFQKDLARYRELKLHARN